MSSDKEIRTACLGSEREGTVISDEIAYAIADRWPRIRDIGVIRPGATPSLEVYGFEDINELRELRALEAWARNKGVTA